MAYENITVWQFERCWFYKDFIGANISEEEFMLCHDEYIDSAGLFATKEFDLVCDIHYLSNRINTIELSIDAQCEFIEVFGEPYKDNVDFIKKEFLYRLKWNYDVTDFLKQLEIILSKEAKYRTELKTSIKTLENDRKSRNIKEKSVNDIHIDFIKMVNSLNKLGYSIVKKETTVQELSIMLKQQEDEDQKIINKYGR